MLKTKSKYASFLFLILLLTALPSCFLRKKIKKGNKKESSWVTNLTTKYNILFNSHYLLQQAQKKIDEDTVDNYQQLLTVFKDPSSASIAKNSAFMDSVIRKSNRIIESKQNSKFEDEAFLIKAKAYFFKGDYFNAKEYFHYVHENAKKHPKLQKEALLWQVRSLLKSDILGEARLKLDEANANPGETDALKALWYATQADYSLVNNNKILAISQLKHAIQYSRNKKDRLRWQYLLGQLHFENGEDQLAESYFNRVVGSNESYETIFYTNLYLVEILNRKTPTVENRVQLLSKLLRDGKNKNYKGQIYQRIGDTYLANKQSELAIEQYELASYKTVNNPYQQSLNHQRLADLYFNEGKYANARLYYDSTIMVLPKDNPAYLQLSRKQSNLDSLVLQLTIIAYQDSLIHLSTLSDEDQISFLEEVMIKNEAVEALKKDRKLKKNKNNSVEKNVKSANNFIKNQTSDFYFSSTVAVSQGLLDFKKRWGNRPASGNWRYGNLEEVITAVQPETAELNTTLIRSKNKSQVFQEQYLKYLPDTPEKLFSTENKIKTATIRLAEIYQNNLHDNYLAIETYENYISRFSDDENTPLVYYHLYRLYGDISPQKGSLYKYRLLNEFPLSLYSKVLNDPDYYKKQHSLLQRFNNDYTLAYNLLNQQKYLEVISKAEQINNDASYANLKSSLAQLAYIRAIAVGRTSEIGAFKTALYQIVERYPTDEIVVPLVNEHIAYIDSNETLFATRNFALENPSVSRKSFEKDFSLTPWPELSFTKQYKDPDYRKEYILTEVSSTVSIGAPTPTKITLDTRSIKIGEIAKTGHENSYTKDTLFPDTGAYVFVINIMHGTINLSPSRFGIGQFNRSQYSNKAINHQLKEIPHDNQLIYIGVFSTFKEAKAYEAKIKPLLNTIMKIPEELYKSFIITETTFNTFTSFEKIEDYTTVYETQQ